MEWRKTKKHASSYRLEKKQPRCDDHQYNTSIVHRYVKTCQQQKIFFLMEQAVLHQGQAQQPQKNECVDVVIHTRLHGSCFIKYYSGSEWHREMMHYFHKKEEHVWKIEKISAYARIVNTQPMTLEESKPGWLKDWCEKLEEGIHCSQLAPRTQEKNTHNYHFVRTS